MITRGVDLLLNIVYKIPIFFAIGIAFANSGPPESKDLGSPEWRVYQRGLQQISHNSRLAVVDMDKGWIGGSFKDLPSRETLLQLTEGQWTTPESAPPESARMSVLDVDADGNLWVCVFGLDRQSTYDGLCITQFNGSIWRKETVSPGIFPQAMDMIGNEEGWIGGNHGLFLHYKNGVWSRVGLPGSEEELKGLNILDLDMYNKDNGWAVGQRGLVARYQNGAWRMFPIKAAIGKLSFRGVEPVGEDEAWAVDVQGSILHFTGNRWRMIRSPSPGYLFDIHMLSPTKGWIVGKPSLFLEYDGQDWKPHHLPGAYSLTDIHMVNAREGWISGDGVILRTTNRKSKIILKEASVNLPFLKRESDYVRSHDLNGDGKPDLITGNHTSPPTFFENNNGFKERSLLETTPQMLYETQAFGFADVDGDRDLDLCYWSWKKDGNLLFRNMGNARFDQPEVWSPNETEPVAESAMSFSDVDQDGDIDIYITRGQTPTPTPISNLLYLNDGNGHFTLTSLLTGDIGGDTYALWGDLDGDNRQDLITPTYSLRNLQLYLNQGDGDFQEIKDMEGLTGEDEGGKNYQGGLVDLDIDGDLDLFFFNGRLQAFENTGRGNFTPANQMFQSLESHDYSSQKMVAIGDLNHDGYPEILLQTTRNQKERVHLFSWTNGRYEDLAEETGIANITGFSAVFDDWDGDGDLDLFISRGYRGHDVLLENGLVDGHYLKIIPHGVLQNRGGLGAQAKIFCRDDPNQSASLKGNQHLSAGGPASQQALFHFGVEAEKRYDLRVIFPGGREVVRYNLEPDQTLIIHEYPDGLRHLLLAWHGLRQLLERANLKWELLRFVLALFLVLGARYLGYHQFGARYFLSRRLVMMLVLMVYLSLSAFCIVQTGLMNEWTPLFIMPLMLGGILILDRIYTRRRDARHIGHYQLLGELGVGGMGVVYRARNLIDGKHTALKVLSPSLFTSETARSRFLREAAIMKQLNHANIVSIWDAGEANDQFYLSMELLNGRTLEDLLPGKPRPHQVLAMMQGVCSALSHMHEKGIVHRDLKCENIFVTGDLQDPNLQDHVKLMDFGLSRATQMESLTKNPGMMGTLAYMSPEQASGQKAGPPADIYALGVALYRLLSGSYPLEAENDMQLLCKIREQPPQPISQVAPEISPQLEKVIHCMLKKKPNDRCSLQQVMDALKTAPEAREVRETDSLPNFPRDLIPNEELDVDEATGQTPCKPSFQSHETVSEMGETLNALHDCMPAAPTRENPSQMHLTEKWRKCYQAAEALEAQGRHSEAQIMRMAFLENLEQILNHMNPSEREAYLQEHGDMLHSVAMNE